MKWGEAILGWVVLKWAMKKGSWDFNEHRCVCVWWTGMPGPVEHMTQKVVISGEEDFRKSKLLMVVRVNGSVLSVWNQLAQPHLFLVTLHF